MSILEILRNPYVLTLVCGLIVFFEMFFAKKWFISFTKKIANEKVRKGLNVIFGIATSFALSLTQLYALSDVIGAVFAIKWAVVAGLAATGLYLIIEKVFTTSEVEAIGKVFCDVISRSGLFDGDLSAKGMVDVAKKLLAIVQTVDARVAAKETEAIDKVVEKLDSFLADGTITEEEKKEAQNIVAEAGIELSDSLLAKYKNLLGK